MSRFTVADTPLHGLKQVQRQRLGDARGSLSRLFCAEELRVAGWEGPVAQINHTVTARAGTLRGMHFQRPPHAEIKFVSCLRGEVFDVAVDLRTGSPTFLQWHAVRLSAENNLALLIPQGFAHGFQSLTDNVELLYCHSAAYAPAAECGLNPMDERLAIAWPLPVTEMSVRDAQHSPIGADFTGVVV
jgi:dTDP-4-dehydrorhamnose 3,5-epimerase